MKYLMEMVIVISRLEPGDLLHQFLRDWGRDAVFLAADDAEFDAMRSG